MKKIPKINSINYGGKWLLTGIVLGVLIPLIVYLIFHVFLWWLCILGGIVLLSFFILLTVEMKQDNSRIPYYEKDLKTKIPFDKENQYAVLRISICTGEKIAGFKDKKSNHFTEVMLIQKPADLIRFKNIYGITDIKEEY